MARRWRWTPRRCLRCRRWLPRHRWRLGLTYCSGRCFAWLYGTTQQAHTMRTGHTTTAELNMPWVCNECPARSALWDLKLTGTEGGA